MWKNMYVNKKNNNTKFSKIKFWQHNANITTQTKSEAQLRATNNPKYNPRTEYILYGEKYNR